MEPAVQDPRQATEFVQLLTSHQRSLYVYILTFLPRPTDADEVLQETNVVLWSKADEFIRDTSFSAWSHRIAYFEVLAFRKRNSRSRLTFSNELMETFAEEAEQDEAGRPDRRAALAACVERLPQRDRDLIGRRYTAGASVEDMAVEVNRPQSSIYRSLERIRVVLMMCVRRKLVAEEGDQ